MRAIARHLVGLTAKHTRQMNRLGTGVASAATPRCVVQNPKRSPAALERRMAKLRQEARTVAEATGNSSGAVPAAEHARRAELYAVQLLGELTLVCSEMTVRKWVPKAALIQRTRCRARQCTQLSRIRRAGNGHLRRSLSMPAPVAAHCDAHLNAFYTSLLDRRKAKNARPDRLARKMPHRICGIFRSNASYDGARLFPNLSPS